MEKKEHLHILWTDKTPITTEKMVFMYALNSLKQSWWEKVTIIIWGATTQVASENIGIQKQINQLIRAGVKVSACKACAEQLGVTETLEKLGIEVKYWGKPLTDLLKSGEPLLTV